MTRVRAYSRMPTSSIACVTRLRLKATVLLKMILLLIKTFENGPCLTFTFLNDFFLQGAVQMFGVRSFKLFSRRIISAGESELDVSAPRWNQQYQGRVTTARNGEPGFNGIHGPRGK